MGTGKLAHEALTKSAIGAFYEVYNQLGFGFLEAVYVLALEYELGLRGHHVAREVPVPVYYKGVVLRTQHMDLLVDGMLVIDAKASERLPASGRPQLLNYLYATDLELGLLLHFGPEPNFERFFRDNRRKNRVESPVLGNSDSHQNGNSG